MSTRTPNLNLINPVASEKGALTTYVTNNNAIDTAYGQSLENVAPIEGNTASKNYAIGTYMVKDGGLYKVTAAIATGETITVGTNVTATSLNEAVADLNSAVATLSTKIGNVGNTSLQSQVSTLQDSVAHKVHTESNATGVVAGRGMTNNNIWVGLKDTTGDKYVFVFAPADKKFSVVKNDAIVLASVQMS